MPVITKQMNLSTHGDAEVIDITPQVVEFLGETLLKAGIVTISVVGSTGAVTTCEFEPGLVQDIPEILDRLIPQGQYHHDQTWGDGNGHSHLRSSFIGPSVTLPFQNHKMILGTWQQIIFIDFDNRPRDRRIVCQFIGE